MLPIPRFGMSNGLALFTGLLPLLVGLVPEPDNATPSVQFDYRTFRPTMGCSAPVPRLGTLILTGTTRLDFFLRIGATGSHVPRKSQMQSHATFMPDVIRTAARPSSGLLPG